MKGRPAELVGGAGGNGALPRLAAGNHVERLFGYIPHQHHGAEIREKGQFPFQHGEALFNHFLRHRAFPFGPLDGVGDVNAGFLRLFYYYKESLCTVIDVNEPSRKIAIKNFVRNPIFCAFGVNNAPTFRDYEEFLESRCFPRSRDKMKIILRDLGLPFYDPFLIIQKTKGKMAEDDFWIEIER